MTVLVMARPLFLLALGAGLLLSIGSPANAGFRWNGPDADGLVAGFRYNGPNADGLVAGFRHNGPDADGLEAGSAAA